MIKRLASAFIIITIILSMLLSSSAGTVLAFANETDDTVPDSEEKIESEAADVTALTEKIAQIKAIDNIEDKYNLKTVKAWLSKAEAAVENKNVQKSEVEALISEYDAIISNVAKPITSAEDFAAMEIDGNYILEEDITLTESFGEFKGFLNGNGKTVTLNGVNGMFGTLNGAVVRNLTVAGEINAESTQDSIAALASKACGEVYVTNVINGANVIATKNDVNTAGFIAQLSPNAKIYFDGCVNRGSIIGGITAGFLADVADGEAYIYFYNCVNTGNVFCSESVNQNPASGFVAKAVGTNTNEIEFKYCANFGHISSTYSSGAFFAYGKANIKMYGCVNSGNVFIDYNKPSDDVGSIGGFIGEACNITVENSIQLGSVIVEDNFEGNPAALLVGGSKDSVELKNVVINGKAIAKDNDVYKITSKEDVTLENVFVNAQLEKRTTFDGTALPSIDVPNADAVDQTPNTDTSYISNEIKEQCKTLANNVILASANTDAESKIQALNLFFELLITVRAEMDFYVAKLEVKKSVEQMTLLPESYTLESYALYIDDVNALMLSITNAQSYEDLENIDIEKSLDTAEAKLMTLEEAQNIALAEAKNTALTALSAKRENAGNMYTATSYTEYITAFDAIVAKINSASTLEALNSIDVAALKVAAEVKLVLVIPEPSEDYGDDENFDNDFDETEQNGNGGDDGDGETLAPITHSKDNGGCSSSLALSSIAIIASFGLAVVIKKKD